jgi:hypothetical protein
VNRSRSGARTISDLKFETSENEEEKEEEEDWYGSWNAD